MAVQFCVRFNIHPDAVSYASIGVSALAAVCFWRSANHPILLIAGPLLCFVRLWLNMLDGMVAIAAGKASLRGEILNDLPDRVSDILIFAGVAHSGLCSILSGYWAARFAILTAYVGMLGQAVGARREFSGLMSKPWRMVWLGVGSLLTFVPLEWDGGKIYLGRLTVLDITCLLIIAGCVQTIAVRLKKIFATLAAKERAAALVDGDS